jgi:hypothetical protein
MIEKNRRLWLTVSGLLNKQGIPLNTNRCIVIINSILCNKRAFDLINKLFSIHFIKIPDHRVAPVAIVILI